MKSLLNLCASIVGLASLPIVTGTFTGTKLGYDVFNVIDGMFNGSDSNDLDKIPNIDIKDNFGITTIYVELPGVPKEEITIAAYMKPIANVGIPAIFNQQVSAFLNKMEIRVSGKRNDSTTYTNTITVNGVSTTDGITALYDNGLLVITIKKSGIVNIPIS